MSGQFCAGNLAHHVDEWSKITSDPWILESVQGYRLEFQDLPFQKSLPRPRNFSAEEMSLIDSEIEKLLEKRAIVPTARCYNEFISNIFFGPKENR